MLNRSRFALLAALLALLGTFVARPMALVGLAGGEPVQVLQPGGLSLVLTRPFDATKLLPQKPIRESSRPTGGDALVPPPQAAVETLPPGSAPDASPDSRRHDAERLAAWPRGPPAA